MATVTTNFDEIQERNIDPHSPVTSENHNKLLKTFGTYHMYVNGFDITFITDATTRQILVSITSGIAYVQYMVIEMLTDATLELCEIPSTDAKYFIVLEYTYRAVKPVPIAYLKVVREENYNPTNQLKLYELNVPRWDTIPSSISLNDWITTPGNVIDCRTNIEYTPTWANKTYLRLDGQNQSKANLKMDSDPKEPIDLVNKRYVDKLIGEHNYAHEQYFVRKNGNSASDDYGTVIDNIDITLDDPYFKLTDKLDYKGIEFKASGQEVTENITKPKLSISVNGNKVSEINAYGITGALWNADIAEYFNTDLTELPEEGTCMCIHNGKAVVSDTEGDPSVIGCISYHPAYILGGTTDFEKELKENHKLPIAIMGQIKNVPYYSSYNLETGGLLISGKNGKFKIISQFDPMNIPGSVIGKAMNSVYPSYGSNYNKVDIIIK